MVDVARDQRWGRGVEGGGEDVLLGELFAAARVRGFQGDNLKSTEHMLACVKHFAACRAHGRGRSCRLARKPRPGAPPGRRQA
jgi:beta-glucosidase